LCGAGRFGYDFENRASKDSSAFSNALEAFKKADTIAFDSYITNEEALILQKLKEKLGVKLVNKDALAYQNFLKEFSLKSKKSLHDGDLEDIKRSGLVVQVGSRSRDNHPGIRYAINEAIKKQGALFVDCHPVEDTEIEKSLHIKYEAGCEEALIALIAKAVVSKDSSTQSFFDALDVGYLQAEANISEKEIETVEKEYKKRTHKTLIIGSDLYTHKRSKNIAKLVGLIEANSDFKVILIPTSTNTLGVSLICDLDKEEGSYTVGYNVEGDFKLSSLGDGELDMPALNQQEGTFTNIDKRVVKLNPALPYSGYELNDIAKALGLTNKHTIDYTKELPEAKGYKSIEFDQLPNSFLNNGKEDRGYLLQNIDCPSEENSSIEPIEELEEYNGTIIYLSNPILQFNRYTAKASELSSELYLSISKTLAEELGVESRDVLTLSSEGGSISLECVVDSSLVNSAVLVPDFIQSKDIDTLFKQSRYIKADIRKV
ncbi:MAG: ferredoxin, partial [Campylobacterales bacterium]